MIEVAGLLINPELVAMLEPTSPSHTRIYLAGGGQIDVGVSTPRLRQLLFPEPEPHRPWIGARNLNAQVHPVHQPGSRPPMYQVEVTGNLRQYDRRLVIADVTYEVAQHIQNAVIAWNDDQRVGF